MRSIAVFVIRGYRYLISPYLPPSCRFHPSCSEYAIQAINAHGLIKGMTLAAKRIARCNPLSAGGHDPVLSRSSDELVSSLSVSTKHCDQRHEINS